MAEPNWIYLDHAATTPLKPEVAQVMRQYLADHELAGNPSSVHVAGAAARDAVERLRVEVATHFACDPADVVFNSGGSEGDTHALVGTALLFERPIRVAISAIEHEAVQEAAGLLRQLGHRVDVLPVGADGAVPLEAVEEELRADPPPQLVSIMAVNNETGVVQPVREVARLCRERGVQFHTDAVRAVGHGLAEIITDPQLPLLNCTAHKFGGPRGVGVLIQRGVRLPQLIRGGGQEQGCRAGTENLVGMAAIAAALRLADTAEARRVDELRRTLEYGLVTRFPNCEIHGKRARRASGITSVSLKPLSGYKLQAALSARGIAVGTGSACHDEAGDDVEISPVLRAMGVEEYLARGTLRISLGWSTTAAEIERLLDTLEELRDADDGSLNCPI